MALVLDQMFVNARMDGWKTIAPSLIALVSCLMKHQFARAMVLASVLMSASAMMDGWVSIAPSLIALVSHPISHLFALARASAPDRTSACAMMDSRDTSVTSIGEIELYQ